MSPAARPSLAPAVRTKSAWLIVVPFFLLASPSRASLLYGMPITAVGLLLRAWSAGTIRKEEVLATTGPYAFLRHPLYVGSFLVGAGLAVAGGSVLWLALFVLYFVTIYGPTVTAETERLTERFGQRYVDYAAAVPAFFPRLTPFRGGDAEGAAPFAWAQYRRNREWEALLGALGAYAALALRLAWFG